MDKYSNIQTEQELRAALSETAASDARGAIASLFDEGTFVETSAFMKRSFCDYLEEDKTGFEAVVTGYGAVGGKLVFCFAFDSSRKLGAVDERCAKKLLSLYETATSNGAPVVGIFDSFGADIFEGVSSLAAYARIMRAVADASGVIPQIAYVTGKCTGSLSTVAAMFDTVVCRSGASLYVTDPAITGATDAASPLVAFTGDAAASLGYLRSLISFLPSCAGSGVSVCDCADDLNRRLGNVTFGGDAACAVAAVADCGSFLSAGKTDAILVAFAAIGGVKCGVVASDAKADGGRLDAASARLAARFIDFCDAFSLPVVTLVDSLGVVTAKENENAPFAADLAKLAFAYAGATIPKITVVLAHAIGAAAVLLGSKALGADLVYAADGAEIGALAADATVAFAFEKYLADGKTREELAAEWRASLASPVAAAAAGEIDDIISTNELRARIASAALMLSAKGTVAPARRAVRPL